MELADRRDTANRFPKQCADLVATAEQREFVGGYIAAGREYCTSTQGGEH